MSSRILVRTRLQEYYERLMLPDMLHACSHIIDLQGIKASIVMNPMTSARLFSNINSLHLHTNPNNPNNKSSSFLEGGSGKGLSSGKAFNVEQKLRYLMELMTGQRASLKMVNPLVWDPLMTSLNQVQRMKAEQAMGSTYAHAVLKKSGHVSTKKNTDSRKPGASKQQSGESSVKKGEAKKAAALASEKAKRATIMAEKMEDQVRTSSRLVPQLCTDLHGWRAWEFLEKVREFYVPDAANPYFLQATSLKNNGDSGVESSEERLARWRAPYGHDNDMPRGRIAGRFGSWIRNQDGDITWRPVYRQENPWSAFTTYCLPYSELLRFPDVEAAYEQLGDLEGVELILRATMTVRDWTPKELKPNFNAEARSLSEDKRRFNALMEMPLGRREAHVKRTKQEEPRIDTLKLMNWFMGQLINPLVKRPYVPAPDAPDFMERATEEAMSLGIAPQVDYYNGGIHDLEWDDIDHYEEQDLDKEPIDDQTEEDSISSDTTIDFPEGEGQAKEGVQKV